MRLFQMSLIIFFLLAWTNFMNLKWWWGSWSCFFFNCYKVFIFMFNGSLDCRNTFKSDLYVTNIKLWAPICRYSFIVQWSINRFSLICHWFAQPPLVRIVCWCSFFSLCYSLKWPWDYLISTSWSSISLCNGVSRLFSQIWWFFLISCSYKLVDCWLSLNEFTFPFLCLNTLLTIYSRKEYHSWMSPLKFRYSRRHAPISMVVIYVIVGWGGRKVGIVVLLWS